MNFNENSYLYNNQQNLQPNFEKIEYNSYQPEIENKINTNIITQEAYQTNYEENNKIENNTIYIYLINIYIYLIILI